jgi:hypothetical protein
MVTSDEEEHAPFVMVQNSVYVEPAVPVNVEALFDGFAMVPPVPELTVHKPVPVVGILPARVVEVSPQRAAPV